MREKLTGKPFPATSGRIEKQSRHTTFVGIAMWLALIGAFLAASAGGHFVFFFSREYRIGAWLGALVLCPFFLPIYSRSESAEAAGAAVYGGCATPVPVFLWGGDSGLDHGLCTVWLVAGRDLDARRTANVDAGHFTAGQRLQPGKGLRSEWRARVRGSDCVYLSRRARSAPAPRQPNSTVKWQAVGVWLAGSGYQHAVKIEV